MDHSKLKAKLETPEISAFALDESKLIELTKPVDKKIPILVHDIQEYLMLTDDLELIESGTSIACKRAVRALELFTQFDIAHPIKGVLIENKLNTILTDLETDEALQFSATDKQAILDMGITKSSWADDNGYKPLRIGYFDKARAL